MVFCGVEQIHQNVLSKTSSSLAPRQCWLRKRLDFIFLLKSDTIKNQERNPISGAPPWSSFLELILDSWFPETKETVGLAYEVYTLAYLRGYKRSYQAWATVHTQWLSQDFPFEQRRLFQWIQSQWLKDHHKHKWELYTYFVTSWSRLSGVLHRGKHDDDGGDGDCRGRPECSTSSADCPRVLMMMFSILREWWWWRWRKKWSESWVSDDEE